MSKTIYAEKRMGKMSGAPLFFQFDQEQSAHLALETLNELGYHVHQVEGDSRPTISVVLESSDLTSALEIAQAHGGTILERPPYSEQASLFEQAYGMHDMIAIPAHVVNEDWVDGYSDREAYRDSYRSGTSEDWTPVNWDGLDPSDDSYDYFTPGARG
jgi:hypothetical protein